ncbi:hypothetical protein DCAR_0209536 [Daucus carota subsp. sativus]|uniref:Programmed cell death protein 2 C-terminal domain-containing protein n=1 Tax=Daucus carota subsp. sativus TaxID=79200 RepID=A0AAF0WLB2_DAUCS|nr:hypothetical protein DCAR_0209536 [Daucus carota subsp. sativus]
MSGGKAENLMKTLEISSSEEEYEDDEEVVWLGLIKKIKLDRFPSPFKPLAGGFPAWLDPLNLPSGTSINCGICGDPLQFLVQLYAPLCEMESAFHRALFIFMCPSMKCLLQDQHEQRKHPSDNPSRRSVKVFRCQLARSNQFYTYEVSHHYENVKARLCSWCRTWKGCNVCGNCGSAHYCSEKHQVAQSECRELAVDPQHIRSKPVSSYTIWPQFKIGIGVEPKENLMFENGGYATRLASACNEDEEFDPALFSIKADADQKSWATFEERVLRAPLQVLRYCRDAGAKPLWPMSGGRPSETDIPTCCYCGGPRCFEVQILLIGQPWSFIHVKPLVMVAPLVMEAWLTKRNLLGFNLLNLLH